MISREGNTIIIGPSPLDKEGSCELCGKMAELRPYGPEGKSICIECVEKNWEETCQQIARIARL